MAFALRCPVCRTKFKWDPTAGFPEYCPNEECSSRIAHDRADDDIVIPFIRHAATSANDQVYRQMEAGSEQRAKMAAEQLGVPVADMSDLKITDLQSTRHEGDIAAPPLPAHLQNYGSFGGGGNGAEHSPAVQAGPFPNAGAKFMTALNQHHAQISHGSAVSHRPALETEQPGYRRRG